MDDVLARLREMQAGDLPVHGGRTLAYVYDSGLPDVDRIGREAVAAYAGSNGLDPTSFPSLLAMENDLVGFACDLLDAPDSAVGSVTSGGTESVLLAVQAARDGSPSVVSPSMVVPSTVHAAFHKAAHYFGVAVRTVPVDADFRADVARDGRRPSTTRRCWSSAPRRRTRTASSTTSPRWLLWPPRGGSAATSTRASAGGCCRTPRGSGGRCRRGRSRCRG